ncbi:MAG TPA: hypothetical protein VIJ49_06650 [Aestuariivirga sp.]
MISRNWVKLPTRWIEDGGLDQLRWAKDGSSCTAALMLLIVVAHNADDAGSSSITYDEFGIVTGLSRTKVSHGLNLLCALKILERSTTKQSQFKLSSFDPLKGWGKLPARRLYHGDRILAFKDFHLRKVTELDALKMYLAFVARRDNSTNLVHITYKQIEEYADIRQERIKSALSLLTVNGLVHVEHVRSSASSFGISNAYRLVHLDTFNHLGTSGRKMIDGSGSGQLNSELL